VSGIADKPLDVLVLTGPTACGKSEASLILAERLGAEIISMDSMKVYRRMDIGTAKPGPEARRRVPHHLVDLREPWETYTVHDYVRDAEQAARSAASRGRRALLEGGTPLYLKAFVAGLFEGPAPDPALRERLRGEARRDGLAALHGRLAAADPAAARRIHPNDERRIVRALEIHEQTGAPISSLQSQFGTKRAAVSARIAVMSRPGETIRERIRERIERMLAAGWLDEARALADLPRPLSPPASRALGYRELWAHLRGEIDLDEARKRIARETWRFVRKQLTWLRSFTEAVWFDASGDAERDAGRLVAVFGADHQAVAGWAGPGGGGA